MCLVIQRFVLLVLCGKLLHIRELYAVSPSRAS